MPSETTPMTPIEALYETARQYPQEKAVLCLGDSWTYGRLLSRMERYASSLLNRGIRPGDRVVIRMRGCMEAVLLSFACMRIGALAVLLSTRLTPHELHEMLSRLRPSLYAGEEDQSQDVADVQPEIMPPAVCFFRGRRASGELASRLEDFLLDEGGGDEAGGVDWEYPDPEAPAVLLTTSGTTAQPKFVVHTPMSLAYVAEAYEPLLAQEDVRPTMMAGTPLSHGSGFVTMMGALQFGRPLRLMPQFDAPAFLDAIENDRCSWLLGAPYMFSQMVAAQRSQPRNLGSLRFCIGVGDSLRPELVQEVLDVFGVELKSLWAATEVMGSLRLGPPGSVGSAAPGARLRLVDRQGCEVQSGDVGELQVQGPNLAAGYWEAPGRIDPARPEGWFATGDLMRFGPGGELFFEGRSKDLIICGGNNVSPLEVEAVLLSHHAVMEAAVCGCGHPDLGQVVVAAVRLGEGQDSGAIGSILQLARDRLADYKVPQRIDVLTQFPRNMLGKLDRRAFQQLMQG